MTDKITQFCDLFVTTPKKKPCKYFIYRALYFSFAEEEGFEPPEPLGSTVFKTAAIDHSATPLIQSNFSKSFLLLLGMQR